MATALNPSEPEPRTGLDRAAVVLSGVCLVHCMAVPLSILMGPLLGQWLQTTETQVHWVLFGLAVPISAIALTRGYRRHHSLLTMMLGFAGLALMLIGVSHWFGEAWEVVLTVIGVTGLLIAHLRNLFAQHVHA